MGENKKRGISTGHDLMKFSREIPAPPPPGFTSPFKTTQEWLSNICDIDQPKKSIAEYCFLLFESPGNELLCLVGYNTYREQNLEAVRVDFKPSNTFFALPQNEYQNLTKQQVRDRVRQELIEFVNSPKFENSFLSKANSITTNFGEKIWPE